MGDQVSRNSNSGLGPRRRHVEHGQGLDGRHGHMNQEKDMLTRLQELEAQVCLIRNENLEFKKVLTRLYSLAQTTHSEVKTQNSKVAEKLEHLEETLGLCYPRKARKTGATSSEMADLGRKMDKLKLFMVHAGNYVDLSSDKNGTAESAGAVMDTGLH